LNAPLLSPPLLACRGGQAKTHVKFCLPRHETGNGRKTLMTRKEGENDGYCKNTQKNVNENTKKVAEMN
jgi:hypothetical protein